MSDDLTLSVRVAEVIRAMLWQRRMSGRQLATELGVSQSWMSTRLAGTTPIDLNELERIAGVFEMEAWDLIPQREGKLIAVGGTSTTPGRESKPCNLRPAKPAGSTGPRGRKAATAPSTLRTGRLLAVVAR